MAIYYLGSFPPEYGGVTIKNQNLFIALKNELEIDKVDFSEIKRKNISELFKLIRVILNKNNRFVIGVAGKKTRKRFCKLLYYLNRKAMSKSIILLMGGTASNDIVADKGYSKFVRVFKKVYVETIGMKKVMDKAGFNNIDIYPNGRFKFKDKFNIKNNKEKLKCVFFSLISPQKGVDNILEVARILPNIDFDFFGPIIKTYEEYFIEQISTLKNVEYKGVFSGSSEAVYSTLGNYDVLLFPTRYKIEGVPGILVESKIAGITAIVSNESYNSEIILNNQGVVLEQNTFKELASAITLLDKNRDVLLDMKKNNQASAELYYIENYIKKIANEIR